MATIYKPIILWDNCAERLGVSASLTSPTGYAGDKLTDGKHWTYYTPDTDGDVVFTIPKDFKVDTVIIQSRKVHADSNVTITYNTGTSWTDVQSGLQLFNVINIDTAMYVESLEIEISQPAGERVEITHLWAGVAQRISNPVYEFDEDMAQIYVDESNENCLIVKNNVQQRKRILQANFENMSTEFDNLFGYNFRYGKPFMFAFRPDDFPYDGGLYHFIQDVKDNPYTAPSRRAVSLNAETPWMPFSKTRVSEEVIETFDFGLPTSYLIDEFTAVGTSWLIDGFSTIETSELIDEFDSIVT